MEKVYLYLPVLMCHSRTDYNDPTTIWNIRAAYFAEQASTLFVNETLGVINTQKTTTTVVLIVPVAQATGGHFVFLPLLICGVRLVQ